MPHQRKNDSAPISKESTEGLDRRIPPFGTSATDSSLLLPISLFRFLNALDTSGDVSLWIRALGNHLTGLFSDVDRVVVRVNLHCRLVGVIADNDGQEPSDAIELIAQVLAVQGVDTGAVPLEMQEPTFDPAEYHRPLSFTYRYADDDLGAILLLRDRTLPQIMPATISMMAELEPFLVFALTDLVARYSYSKPISRLFHTVLYAIADQAKLTNRELEVLTLHMFGRKYDEIARRLYISIDTVKKHVKRIHRKTGTRSATQLFARYFTPLIDGGDHRSDQ